MDNMKQSDHPLLDLLPQPVVMALQFKNNSMEILLV